MYAATTLSGNFDKQRLRPVPCTITSLIAFDFLKKHHPNGFIKGFYLQFYLECQAIKHFYHSLLINTPFRSGVSNKSLPVFNRCTGTELAVESSHKWNRHEGSTVRLRSESVLGCLRKQETLTIYYSHFPFDVENNFHTAAQDD